MNCHAGINYHHHHHCRLVEDRRAAPWPLATSADHSVDRGIHASSRTWSAQVCRGRPGRRLQHNIDLPTFKIGYTSGLSPKQSASSRPHFRAARKNLVKIGKNFVRNRSRTDEIDTETGIWLILTLFRILRRSVKKRGTRYRKNVKMWACTPLKSDIYFWFRFVSKTIGVEATGDYIIEPHAKFMK